MLGHKCQEFVRTDHLIDQLRVAVVRAARREREGAHQILDSGFGERLEVDVIGAGLDLHDCPGLWPSSRWIMVHSYAGVSRWRALGNATYPRATCSSNVDEILDVVRI